jgi:hypothetical protein
MLKGKPPNLDVVLQDDRHALCIESKLLEHLSGGCRATFQPSYAGAIAHAHASWQGLYEALLKDPCFFSYLDTGQLVRHYLGIKTQIADGGRLAGKKATLLYFYWEPDDADDQRACILHREEVARLAARVSDPSIRFDTMTHRDLWRTWARSSSEPDWLPRHAQLLEARYGLSLGHQGPCSSS